MTSRKITKGGVALIPVTGEMHYSRVPRSRWRRRLEQMKAGGITTVASYLIWIHHQPDESDPDFTGNRDIAAFVELCRELDLAVVLRLGPWIHGETRNGGLPDWVQNSGYEVRTNDAGYMAMVDTWFRSIADQVADLCRRGDTIVAIQLDNELYDQPEHLLALKELAISKGLVAPIYTATGWGSAQLPEGELLPLFGGYADGFWVDSDLGWDASFHDHFFFSHSWDDPGIGADLRDTEATGVNPSEPLRSGFPPATCELGGGMATAYHRRPVLSALDVATVAHNKIGNGSAWQGYYMYAGGQNPADRGPLQESHASNYPNDMPRWDYDFHAPIGSSGSLNESYAHLRRQHAFLAAFGDRLALMSSTLPSERPLDVSDSHTLRWALRSDGTSGFVFISWHQPYEPLDDHPPVHFSVELADRTIEFPASPVTIPRGTLAHWPIALTVGGVTVDWATASALTILDGPIPTLVLTAESGVDAHIAFAGSTQIVVDTMTSVDESVVTLPFDTAPSRFTARTDGGELNVLVLSHRDGLRSWVVGGSKRRLLLSGSPLWESTDGIIAGEILEPIVDVVEYDTVTGIFAPIVSTIPSRLNSSTPVAVHLERHAGVPSGSYGSFEGRASAPADEQFVDAARFRVELPGLPTGTDSRSELVLRWEGDVARLLVDGVVVSDRFWDGTEWTVDLDVLGMSSTTSIELEILPLLAVTSIWLPHEARERLDSSNTLCSVLDASVRIWTTWTETSA